MIEIAKKIMYFLIVSILSVGVVSCNDTTDIEEGTEGPTEVPYEVTLGFGLVLDPIRDSNLQHNFTKEGYKVDIKGNLVEGDMTLENVDLTQPIILEVTGSIEVTVKHPDFKKKNLGEVAYYGLDKVDVETYEGSGVIPVALELVQGYVAVEANTFMEGMIKQAKVGKDEVELNTIYYTDETKKELKVKVEFEDYFDTLEGEHENVIGEGVVYEVTLFDAIGGVNAYADKNIKFEDIILTKNRSYISIY